MNPNLITLSTEDLGDPMTDDDMVRNGLWNLEGPYGHPLYALGGDENWDYAEVGFAWMDHAAAKLAAHGIKWDADADTVQLPATMATADAERIWQAVRDEWDDWVIAVVDEARDGAGQAPPDGIRPTSAPGSRWITESSND